MRTQPLRLAALAVALAACGTSLFAQGRGPGFGPGHGPAGEGMGFRKLNLSAEQQTKMKAIHEKHKAAIEAKRADADKAHQALKEGMANLATDAKALQALHEKASAAQFALMQEHRAVRQEIVPLLSAEQKIQFEKQPMGMGSMRGPGMGQMGRPGMGPRGGRGPGFAAGPGCQGMNSCCQQVKPS